MALTVVMYLTSELVAEINKSKFFISIFFMLLKYFISHFFFVLDILSK